MRISDYIWSLRTTRFFSARLSALAFMIGHYADMMCDATVDAVKMRWPTHAPSDAVRLLGAERGIYQGPGEPLASYALRVRGAWGAWGNAGAVGSLLSQLEAISPSPECWENHTSQQSDASRWHRFWIVWPAGTHSWSTASSLADAAATTRLVAERWKRSRSTLASVVIVESGQTVDQQTRDGVTPDALETATATPDDFIAHYYPEPS